MNVIKADIAQPILLGRQGEHGATQVVFDLSGYIRTYGDGVAQLAVKRPGDPVEYAAVLTQEGDNATWEIGPEWTAIHGQGYCYLHWFVDDDHVKSDKYKTLVQESKSACVDVPEPQTGYLDQVLGAASKVTKLAEQAAGDAAKVINVAKRFDIDFAETVERAGKEAQASSASAAGSARIAQDEAIEAKQQKESAEAAARTATDASQVAERFAHAADIAAEQARVQKDAALRAADRAESYTNNPPTVGENGNWWEWDGIQYVDSGRTSVGRSIAGLQFNAQNGRWEVTYTDGSKASIDGLDPVDSTIWSIMGDDFERYEPGENTFMEQAAADWRVSNGYATDNIRHDVVEDGENKYLMVRSLTGDRATTVLQHTMQGERVVEVDYMSTYEGEVEQGKTVTDCLDIRLFNVNSETFSAKVNNLGTNRLYSVIGGGKALQSPIIKDKDDSLYRCQPNVWYRIKVYIRVGKAMMKIWKRDSESEPVDGAAYGVSEREFPFLTPEFLAVPHELRFYLGEFANVAVPDGGWRIGLDNVKVYRDTKDGIVEKVLEALPVYDGEVVAVTEVEDE